MSFHECRFPTTLTYGTVGGPGYFTQIIKGDNNQEYRIARWSAASRKYDAKYAIKSHENVYEVYEFMLCRLGSAYGFRLKDFIDFSSSPDGVGVPTPTDQHVATGNGSTTAFQLQKGYSSGGYAISRNITKPVTGTVRVALNGVEQLSGVTVNTTTGIITFAVAPGVGVAIRAGFYFDVPVRFGADIDKWLQINIQDFDIHTIDSIMMEEIMDIEPVAQLQADPGGALEICPVAPFSFDLTARLWVVATDNADTGYLPDRDTVPLGGPLWVIVNNGPDDLIIKEEDLTTTFATLGVGEAITIYLSQDYTGDRIWYGV